MSCRAFRRGGRAHPCVGRRAWVDVQGTQQRVVGVVGVTPPVGVPPMGGHDTPVGTGAETSMMFVGSPIDPQVVTLRGVLEAHSFRIIAGHEPAMFPQVQVEQARSSFASP